MKTITVSIIEDNKVISDNVTRYIDYSENIAMVHSSASVESFLHNLDTRPHFKSDVLLLDIGLPGMSGLDAISILSERLPDTNIMMLTTYEEEEKILKALCNGAVGYISKKTSLEDIMIAIRIVDQGGSYMSPSIAREIVKYFGTEPKKKNNEKKSILSARQEEVLDLLAKGSGYIGIAEELNISPETVKSHIKKIYRTLKVNNKAAAITKFLKGEIY